MSFDIKIFDVKTSAAATQFEVEAERRREVLVATSRVMRDRRATSPMGRQSRLSALARMVAGPVTARPARGSARETHLSR